MILEDLITTPRLRRLRAMQQERCAAASRSPSGRRFPALIAASTSQSLIPTVMASLTSSLYVLHIYRTTYTILLRLFHCPGDLEHRLRHPIIVNEHKPEQCSLSTRDTVRSGARLMSTECHTTSGFGRINQFCLVAAGWLRRACACRITLYVAAYNMLLYCAFGITPPAVN